MAAMPAKICRAAEGPPKWPPSESPLEPPTGDRGLASAVSGFKDSSDYSDSASDNLSATEMFFRRC